MTRPTPTYPNPQCSCGVVVMRRDLSVHDPIAVPAVGEFERVGLRFIFAPDIACDLGVLALWGHGAIRVPLHGRWSALVKTRRPISRLHVCVWIVPQNVEKVLGTVLTFDLPVHRANSSREKEGVAFSP